MQNYFFRAKIKVLTWPNFKCPNFGILLNRFNFLRLAEIGGSSSVLEPNTPARFNFGMKVYCFMSKAQNNLLI